MAAVRGHLEVVRCLLEQGADRDKVGNSGWTPLHYAANYGHLEIAMLLMSYGADLLNAKTINGQLPIDLARTEEIKQAICDEPRRRMDHGHKRATEQDRHPNASIEVTTEQQVDEHGNNRSRIDEGAVAEEDEDSELSSDEEEEN